VRFSPDGSLIAAGTTNNDILIWRVADGSLVRTLSGHPLDVYSIDFSPDGRYLISSDYTTSSGYTAQIRIWDLETGTPLEVYDRETSRGVASICFSPNGRYFGYGRYDATIVVANNPFYTPPIDGDVNGDGCVDDADLLAVLFAFGNTGNNLPEDVTQDGVVDDADLLLVLFNFGTGC
jgi:WD40 repeat protein